MKSQKTKEQALALYINNLSTEKIAKEIGVTRKSIEQWSKKGDWYQIREKAIQASIQKAPDKYSEIIDQQINITLEANKQLSILIKKKLLKPMELIVWAKHGLEVVRPKTVSQFNFMKQDNKGVFYKFEVDDGTGDDKTVEETKRSIPNPE